MARLPRHARASETHPEPPREPPLDSMGPGETWRWSVGTVARSPLLLATLGLVGVAVGATTAAIQHPVGAAAILLGYVVQTAVAAAYVAEVTDAGETGHRWPVLDVLRTGLERAGAVVLTAIVLAVTLTMLVEAILIPIEAVAHPFVLGQAGVLVVLVLVARSAFAGPMAVIDREPPLQAIVDGWLLTGEATTSLLSLHVTLALGAIPVGIVLVLAPSTASVALSAGLLGVLSGLFALCLARTYVESRYRHEVAERSRTPAWELEGAPTVRR